MMRIGAMVLCLSVALAAPASAESFEASHLVTSFMKAWRAADAKALSALFAADGDLVTPTGIESKGRTNIEAFYAAAFARGYAGSIGSGEVVDERILSPEISLIDARWSIMGAHNADGSVRPDERGIMVVVIGKEEAGWRILALRESSGAADFTSFPPRR